MNGILLTLGEENAGGGAVRDFVRRLIIDYWDAPANKLRHSIVVRNNVDCVMFLLDIWNVSLS